MKHTELLDKTISLMRLYPQLSQSGETFIQTRDRIFQPDTHKIRGTQDRLRREKAKTKRTLNPFEKWKKKQRPPPPRQPRPF